MNKYKRVIIFIILALKVKDDRQNGTLRGIII